jgi:nitrite reductase/ring-hydroxylating ferredoxin subunit
MGEATPKPDSPGEQPATDDAAWQRLGTLDPRTTAFPARAKVGDEGIVIFRTGERFFGVQRACPHQGGNMLDAVIQGNGALIRCPRHNYVFRTANGNPVNCPGFRLRVFEVKEEDGRLFARTAPIA